MRRLTSRCGEIFVVAFALLALSGCSSNGEPASISGTVKFDGKDIPDGDILFRLGEGEEQIVASAKIVEGKYQIPLDDGLIAGEYLVSISASRKTGRKVETFEQIGAGASGTMEEIEQYIPVQFNSNSTYKVVLEPGDNVHEILITSEGV